MKPPRLTLPLVSSVLGLTIVTYPLIGLQGLIWALLAYGMLHASRRPIAAFCRWVS